VHFAASRREALEARATPIPPFSQKLRAYLDAFALFNTLVRPVNSSYNREQRAVYMRIFALSFMLAAIVAAHAQGTIVFHNRGLTDPTTGATYNAPFSHFCESSSAQLFLVSGSGATATYTPLFPMQAFRPVPDNLYFTGPVVVTVPNVPAGTTGVRVVVRAWQGATWETATYRGESNEVTVGPLGGIPQTGPPLTPPGLDGFQSFFVLAGNPACIPEPSSWALAMLGAVFFIRGTKKKRT
jgi:hypothetical protein